MKKIKRFFENIIAFVIAIFIFGTIYLIAFSLIDKTYIKFNWQTYINTGIVLTIMVIADFINQKYKQKK